MTAEGQPKPTYSFVPSLSRLYLALTAPKYLVSSSKDMVPLSDVLTFFAMAVAAGNIL